MVSAGRSDAAAAAPGAGRKQDRAPGAARGRSSPAHLTRGRAVPRRLLRQRVPTALPGPRLAHLRPGGSVLITPSGPLPRHIHKNRERAAAPPAASTPSAARSPGGMVATTACSGLLRPGPPRSQPQSGCSRWAPGKMLGVCIVFA